MIEEILMSEQEHTYPAPWQLTGSGVVLVMRLSKSWKARYGLSDYKGLIASLCLVNYQTSPVGPYCEILFIPGTLKNPKGKHLSISHIFVDSENSMKAGQKNWGIPKKMAKFDWQDDGKTVQVDIKHEGHPCFTFKAKRLGPSIPIIEAMLPITLYQKRDNHHFWTKPKAKGQAKFASVSDLGGSNNEDGQGFPDLSSQTILAASIIDGFSMRFPEAIQEK
ncbi:MAG: hypothetical protein ACJASL_004177 [Paraglaciecola sp.]|jgi:hypothetical protein